VNTDEFTKRALQKVGYESNPVEDGSLDSFHVHPIALTSMTVEALKGFDISKKDAERSKNMFALGLLCWLYNRPTEGTVKFLNQKFGKKPDILAANLAAFKAGHAFGETTEDFAVSYEVKPAPMDAGT
ncbi:MAG: 2-oxoacid:acceptor oxidoreductase family protein, partial [Actinobacteria bacterium]|nr:2-oxoacid:acceptor oxidoreductase family protein [Actinomycetota bacterium]